MDGDCRKGAHKLRNAPDRPFCCCMVCKQAPWEYWLDHHLGRIHERKHGRHSRRPIRRNRRTISLRSGEVACGTIGRWRGNFIPAYENVGRLKGELKEGLPKGSGVLS